MVSIFILYFLDCFDCSVLSSKHCATADEFLGGDIFQMDQLFIPINVRKFHWLLAVVDIKEECLAIYDSLPGKNGGGGRYLGLIQRYLGDHFRSLNHGRDHPTLHQWRLINVAVPHQEISNDCGVFLCLYVDFILLQYPLVFQQKDISLNGRAFIGLAILQKFIG
jgi:Ulp1 family protease